MDEAQIKQFTSWLGKQSYKSRVDRFGIERIREIARENGKKGGRPRRIKPENIKSPNKNMEDEKNAL